MERPRLAPNWSACAGEAVTLLRERERTFPARVEAGTLDPSTAKSSLRVARALVAQWRWALAPEQAAPPGEEGAPFGAFARELADQVAAVLGFAQRRAADHAGDETAAARLELAEALHWHQQPLGLNPRIVTEAIGAHRHPALRYRLGPEDAELVAALGLAPDRRMAA